MINATSLSQLLARVYQLYTYCIVCLQFSLQARDIFTETYPGEEYLPRIPDPSDIVYEDDEPSDDKGEAPSDDVDDKEGSLDDNNTNEVAPDDHKNNEGVSPNGEVMETTPTGGMDKAPPTIADDC